MSKQSYLKRFTAICAVAAAGMVLGATSDLPVLDSSKFDFKYEMDVLPTFADLDDNGIVDFTGGGNWLTLDSERNVAVMDMRNTASYLNSSANAGSAGGMWRRYAPNDATGYTIETRLKVISQNNSWAAAISASPSDSTSDAMLSFSTNSIGWSTTKIVNLPTADAFHTYRIAKFPNEDRYIVWYDGNVVTNGLTDALPGYGNLNRLLCGAVGGTFRSLVELSYFRFTKGAYAPKPMEMDSAGFPRKYEMASIDEGFSPTSSTTAWELISGEEGTAALENGILSVMQPNKQMRYWKTTGPMDDSVVPGSSLTFETRLRITDAWSANGNVLNFLVGVPGASCLFFVNANSISWRDSKNLETSRFAHQNTDRMHVFRVTYCAGRFTLWRDGEKLGEDLAIFSTESNVNYARFGVVSTSAGGSFDVDYIRWTTEGAFAPVTADFGTAVIFR